MARTVYARGTSYVPNTSAKWFLFTTDPVAKTAPTFAELNLSATIDITAGVAEATGFQTGVNVISESEWGAATSALPFSAATGKTVEMPTLMIWADVAGTDLRASLAEGARKTIGYLPQGDTAASKAEMWDLTCVNTDLGKGKGAFAQLGFQFTVNAVNKAYTVPAS